VRSLARRKHRVLVGETTPWSKAGWSRHSSGSFRYASPQSEPQRFLSDLLNQAEKEPGTLILPMTEKSTLLISAARDQFAAVRARTIFPAHEDLLRAVDKNYTTGLASSLGIATPRTYTLEQFDDLGPLEKELAYPLVLKPRTSEEKGAEGGLRATGRPRYASNRTEARHVLTDMRKLCSSVIAQEFVEGTGSGYFALLNRGELIAEFAHRRIRDVHPTGSGSALRESILPPPAIREPSLKMLQALRWHGMVMVEYRVQKDDTPVFLEINGRFWHSLPLACYAGVDFPGLLAEIAEHGDVKPSVGYKVGVRCRWFVGDFRHLVEVWKGRPPGYPGYFPKRSATLLAELAPKRGTFHDNFMWQDPLPELGDWLQFAGKVMQRRSG